MIDLWLISGATRRIISYRYWPDEWVAWMPKNAGQAAWRLDAWELRLGYLSNGPRVTHSYQVKKLFIAPLCFINMKMQWKYKKIPYSCTSVMNNISKINHQLTKVIYLYVHKWWNWKYISILKSNSANTASYPELSILYEGDLTL